MRRHFTFYHAARRILHQDECASLQKLLHLTGSFIWGAAAHEFFTRELVTPELQKVASAEPVDTTDPVDVEIFVGQENLWHFYWWLEQEQPDFVFDPDSRPLGRNTYSYAKQEFAAVALARRQRLVMYTMRFNRVRNHPMPRRRNPDGGDADLPLSGLRLIITSTTPVAAMLESRSSEERSYIAYTSLTSLHFTINYSSCGHELCGWVCCILFVSVLDLPGARDAGALQSAVACPGE